MAARLGTSFIFNVLWNREVHQEKKQKLIQATGMENDPLGNDPHPKQQGIWVVPWAQLMCSSCLWQTQADLAGAHPSQSCSRDPFSLLSLGSVTAFCSSSFPTLKFMGFLFSPFILVWVFSHLTLGFWLRTKGQDPSQHPHATGLTAQIKRFFCRRIEYKYSPSLPVLSFICSAEF